jgi:hypothetical protein
MIGYRFWKSIKWNSNDIRESRLAVLWILVESGALYSVTTIFLLGFSVTNMGAIFAAALGQISVRCPCLRWSVIDTQWDFDVLGVGPDTDYCTGRAERLAFVFNIHACEGIDQRSLWPT